MKNLTLALLIVLAAIPRSYGFDYLNSYSSKAARNIGPGSCPKVYLGVSSGLENPGGLVGFQVDVPVTEWLSLGGGGGLSSWGAKVYGEARFYFSPCNRGWAIGTGISHNTGISNFNTTLSTNYGDQDVNLTLKPVTNFFISAYRFWNLGHSGHRFYLQAGYSFRLSDDYYTLNSQNVYLNATGRQEMQILAPGGLMVAVGFSFGLGGR